MDINENNHISTDEDIEQIARALLKESKTSQIVTVRYFKDKANNEPGVKYRRFKSIPFMEKRGLLEIIQPVQKSSYRKSFDPNDLDIVEYDVYNVRVNSNELVNVLQKAQSTNNKQIDIPSESKKPPKEWSLKEDEKQAHVIRNDEVVYTFPRNWAQKYKYFKYLWNHYNQYVQYKLIYEVENNSHYPNKGITKINGNIRNTFRKLEKDMNNKGLSVKFEINKGVKLTFTN